MSLSRSRFLSALLESQKIHTFCEETNPREMVLAAFLSLMLREMIRFLIIYVRVTFS